MILPGSFSTISFFVARSLAQNNTTFLLALVGVDTKLNTLDLNFLA